MFDDLYLIDFDIPYNWSELDLSLEISLVELATLPRHPVPGDI